MKRYNQPPWETTFGIVRYLPHRAGRPNSRLCSMIISPEFTSHLLNLILSFTVELFASLSLPLPTTAFLWRSVPWRQEYKLIVDCPASDWDVMRSSRPAPKVTEKSHNLRHLALNSRVLLTRVRREGGWKPEQLRNQEHLDFNGGVRCYFTLSTLSPTSTARPIRGGLIAKTWTYSDTGSSLDSTIETCHPNMSGCVLKDNRYCYFHHVRWDMNVCNVYLCIYSCI